MKAVFVFFFICLFAGVVKAQEGLHTALGKGDLAGISTYFGERIDLTVLDKEEVLPRAEAILRLNAFYATHVPKGFRPVHDGVSKNTESTYTIGELSTDKGNFRVYIYFTQAAQKRLVEELRIEKN